MRHRSVRLRTARFWQGWLAGALLLAAQAPGALAQTIPAVALDPAVTTQEKLPPPAFEMPAEVAPGPVSAAVGCAGCGSGGCCYAGRFRDCCGCNTNTFWGRCLCNFYEELCCPDPCYEGKWIPAANAAFFVEGTRPVTTSRIRWDHVNNFIFPDKAEFFWAKSGGNGGKGPGKIETSLNYDELWLYQEIAAKGFSFFFDIPYIAIDPEVNNHGAGWSDIRLGTKSLLFDRDLFQVGFMFTTILPVGNFTKGVGTGHVSLEPSLLFTLKLTPTTYFQSQLSEWIPIGGDADYQGSIFHYHFSLNQVLLHPLADDIQLIGTLEFQGYSFQDGAFSDPNFGQNLPASGNSYLSAGPGLRLVICDWLDFGVAAQFAMGPHGPDQFYRTEFRVRY